MNDATVNAYKKSDDMINVDEADNLVPEKDRSYVPFGHFEDVMAIIKSKMFYPTFVTGLSGNGKTFMVQQACARAKRELIRVNVTAETDEDDLLGGFRLKNENGATRTVFNMGPVPIAMKRGAILLLDEVDCGTPKLMALQPVLEGMAVYMKKINQIISPAPGFNIIACANTKGRGDVDGKFVGTNIMNEAFLERFTVTFEQDYPDVDTERKILKGIMSLAGEPDASDLAYIDNLLKWAYNIRKTYNEGAISDIITTRRLVGIVKSYCIFNRNRIKALTLAVNRFDTETKKNFIDLYNKIDGDTSKAPSGRATAQGQHVPF
jgi:MoxR-like ATPase